ncbi:hypothetical protein [Flagellimonas onchidii]|nr:hypothetical protein [Allomuricauda onchidii]
MDDLFNEKGFNESVAHELEVYEYYGWLSKGIANFKGSAID